MSADPTHFLVTMSALCTAVQTFMDHVVKGRIPWLDTATPANPSNEGKRQTAVHLISAIVGGVMAASVQLKPLGDLGLAGGDSAIYNWIAAAVLTSFGSSFFNEALDAVRNFKKAQEGVRQAQVAAGVALPKVTS